MLQIPFALFCRCACLAQMVECLFECGARNSDVEPHKAIALCTEHCSVVESKMGAVDEEVDELVVTDVQPAAVEPHEETGLRTNTSDLRDVATKIVFHK